MAMLMCSVDDISAQKIYSINTQNTLHSVDENIYGHFLEHIYHSANGGLWGELVWNRSLEMTVGTEGVWSIEDTVITQSSLNENVRLLFGETNWTDYEINLKAQKTGGNEGFLIMFRANGENFYWCNIAGWGNTQHAIEKGTPGVRWSVFNGNVAAGSIQNGVWYDIKIRCEGNSFQVWMNESLIFNFTDNAAHLSGQAGIGTWGTSAMFSNISLTSIASGDTLFKGLPNLEEESEITLSHWEKVGTPEIYASDNALNSNQSIRLVNKSSEEAGIQQHDFYFENQNYTGSFWAKGNTPEGFTLKLLNRGEVLAQESFPAPQSDWQQYSFELNPGISSTNGTLQLVLNDTGTVFIDQVSLMGQDAIDNNGYRPDLYQAIDGLKPPIIRWPGGCYVSAYFWKDGIGPQSERKSYQINLWEDIDVNSYGTDEFLQMCEALNIEPLIVVNTGILDVTCGAQIPVKLTSEEYLQDALDWMEYCNGDADTTTWGAIRAANGHPEPYNVKYWEIDNEVWVAGTSAYNDVIKIFAPAMRAKYPDIKIIACGSSAFDQNWNRSVLNECADLIDYISTHHYENIMAYSSGVTSYENFLIQLGNYIESSSNPDVEIYMSEWNVWSPIDWRNGLYAAGMLNAFERQGEHFTMSGPALWLRHSSAGAWNNALINFNNAEWFAAPNYVVMKLWRDYYAPNFVELNGTYSNLNAVATVSSDSSLLYFKIVNTSAVDEIISLEIDPGFEAGNAVLRTITAPSLYTSNSFSNPENIKVVNGRGSVVDGVVQFTSPAYSAMVVIVDQDPPSSVTTQKGNGFQLRQNTPNPFGTSTQISYDIEKSDHVRLRVLDVSGRTISILVDEFQESGTYQVQWNGTHDSGKMVTDGLYLYELSTSTFEAVNVMSVLQ